MQFDGSNDRVTIANTAALNPSQLTVECWVNFAQLASGNNWEWIVGKGPNTTTGNYLLAQGGSSGNFMFELTPYTSNWSVTGGSNLQADRWYHVAGTYDGQTIKIYIDGVLQGSKTVGTVVLGTTASLYLGSNNGSQNYLNGSLDEVRLWNCARSQDEIRAIMQTHLNGNETGLVAYWDFNEEVTSQDVLDKTANANNGLLGSSSSAESSDPTRVGRSAPPTVTIDQAVGQADPTNVSPINFTVVFSKPVTDFVTGDVTLGGTAGATTAEVTNPSLDHIHYNVVISGMTGDGTVLATIDPCKAHDAAGNASTASTSSDNSVIYDITAPTLIWGTPTPLPNAAGWNNSDVSVPYTVVDGLSGLSTSLPPTPLVLTTEGNNVTGMVTVTDLVGNTATFLSPAFKIDKTAPTLSWGTATPAPNAAGWNNTDVSVPYTVDDALSGCG